MNQPDYSGALLYARSRMQKELAPELCYHGLEHTFEHVLPAAMQLAEWYELDQEEVRLLEIAAAFHDIGWIDGGVEHEKEGIRIAREILPSYGFRKDQIDRIAGIIKATRPPQAPQNLLEQIMVDADLDVLGREDYWLRNEDLRSELSLNGHRMSDEEWCLNQLQFLESHNYYTDAARQLRDEGKQTHIEELKKRLDQLG
ncbi:MAG TPA: HD domain-containing protein [candidate division Zixibacteria bacterium]|nr:HD domain-containing protein [candidate division Zixibacteria bacterium]